MRMLLLTQQPSAGTAGPMAALLVAASITLAPWAAPAAGGDDWGRSDTQRCRVHWSAATPWAAARVLEACDDVVQRAGVEGSMTVVVEDSWGAPSGVDGVAWVPASPMDDRTVGGSPTIRAALARAVGQAAEHKARSAVLLEVTALGAAGTPRSTAGGVVTLGDTGRAAVTAVGEARLRAERAGGPGWTREADMHLRVMVRSGAVRRPKEEDSGRLHAGQVAVQGYSFARFIADRFDGDPWTQGTREALHVDWLARAQAVYADQIEAIGPEVAGVPAGAESPGFSWPTAAPGIDRLRLSDDSRWLGWSDGGYVVATAHRGAPEVTARTLRLAAPGGFDWSPGGDRLLVADGQLYVVDLAGGQRRRLTDGLVATDPAWSPGGERIAFVHRRDGRARLGLVDVDRPAAGITWILAPRDGAWIGRPDWSADGRWLVFEMFRGGRWDLWAIGRGGGDLRPLTWDVARERDPVIDPRGRAVWFSSDAGGVFDIRRLDLLTGQVERITRVHGGALSPAVTSSGELLYLSCAAAGFEVRRLADPVALQRQVAPRPGSLVVAASLLPDDTALDGARSPGGAWPFLPVWVVPQALWDEALSAGLRAGVMTPGGSQMAAGILLGSAWSADLSGQTGGAWRLFAVARWLSISRPLVIGVDADGDPATLAPARATNGDGDAAWRTARAGVRRAFTGLPTVEAFIDLLDADGDGRLGAGGGSLRRLGSAVALSAGGDTGDPGRLRIEVGLFATDLAEPLWDGVENLGVGDAAGGGFDYVYERALLESALDLPVPWLASGGRRLELRLRGGWIGRNVSPEEELFAGLLHPADRLRPARTAFGLSGYDEFSVRGETLLLAGVAWRTPVAAAWGSSAGSVGLSGGWFELFADAGNAWGHSAQWQRTGGGAVVTDPSGRPVAVPGSVKRESPLQHGGGAGPRWLTEVGVEVGVGLRLFHTPWGSTLRATYGFQARRGAGDIDGDGFIVRGDPADPLGSEQSPAGLRIALALGTALP